MLPTGIVTDHCTVGVVKFGKAEIMLVLIPICVFEDTRMSEKYPGPAAPACVPVDVPAWTVRHFPPAIILTGRKTGNGKRKTENGKHQPVTHLKLH